MMISGVIVPRREESGDMFEMQHCHCIPLGSSWQAVGGEFWRPPNTIKESVTLWFEIGTKFWYGTKGHGGFVVRDASH